MKGYVILIVVFILSAVLSLVVFSSINRFLEHKSTLINLWLKEKLKASADACLEVALLKLKYDANYAGNETVSVDNSNCQILPIETTQNTFKIKAKSENNLLAVFLFLEVNQDDFSIMNYEEKVSF